METFDSAYNPKKSYLENLDLVICSLDDSNLIRAGLGVTVIKETLFDLEALKILNYLDEEEFNKIKHELDAAATNLRQLFCNGAAYQNVYKARELSKEFRLC